jgi:hypothetical protein
MTNKENQANQIGQKAFNNDLGQVPAGDKDLAPLFEGCQVGDGQAAAIISAWLDGWHLACDAKLATL